MDEVKPGPVFETRQLKSAAKWYVWVWWRYGQVEHVSGFASEYDAARGRSFGCLGRLAPPTSKDGRYCYRLIHEAIASVSLFARKDLAGFLDVLCRLFERAYHILARDYPCQLAIRPDNRKAAALKAHHQLENSCQWCCRFDMHDGFGHHFGDRPLHQLIVMGYHLTEGEGKGSKKINLSSFFGLAASFHDRPEHWRALPA